jgi:hypothetical protein
MSYQALIDKLKKTDQKNNTSETDTNDRKKLGFLEFKEPSILRFRILPNKKDPDDVPFEKVFIHLGFEHPNFGSRKPLACKGRDCPLCSFYRKREKGGDANAWRYKSNQKFIYYVEYYDDKNQLRLGMLSLTYYAHEELKNKMITQLKSGVNIFDLKDGRWIEMTMKKIGDKRKYIVSVESESDEVTDIEILDWYKEARPLHKFYKEYSVDELKKIIKGEKLDMPNQSNSAKPTTSGSSSVKTEKKVDMKFASDEVESIDGDEEEVPSNMKRLEDIMNRTDEEDFE